MNLQVEIPAPHIVMMFLALPSRMYSAMPCKSKLDTTGTCFLPLIAADLANEEARSSTIVPFQLDFTTRLLASTDSVDKNEAESTPHEEKSSE